VIYLFYAITELQFMSGLTIRFSGCSKKREVDRKYNVWKEERKKIKQQVRLKYKGAWRFCDFLDQGVEEDGNHPYFNLQYIRYGVIDPVDNQLLFYTFDNGRTFLVEEDYLKLSKK